MFSDLGALPVSCVTLGEYLTWQSTKCVSVKWSNGALQGCSAVDIRIGSAPSRKGTAIPFSAGNRLSFLKMASSLFQVVHLVVKG